jgi:hypothetical protein
MKLNFMQIMELLNIIEELRDVKMPFALSMIFAKNVKILNEEKDFYIEREREFVQKYLETNEAGEFVQQGENIFKIKDGMEQECQEARYDLDNFTSELALRTIPVKLIENMEFTPKQLFVLEMIIEEE